MKSTLIKIVQTGKIFFVTKNLENTNNINDQKVKDKVRLQDT
jgi:hypothetical protein